MCGRDNELAYLAYMIQTRLLNLRKPVELSIPHVG